jgi:hypothetical protein
MTLREALGLIGTVLTVVAIVALILLIRHVNRNDPWQGCDVTQYGPNGEVVDSDPCR